MAGPADATPVYEAQKRAPSEYKVVAEFLRGKNGPKIRRGILNGKRCDYFKGKTAIRVLNGPAYQKLKKAPKVTSEEEAKALLAKVLPHAFFLRVNRPDQETPQPGTPRPLLLAPSQSFDETGYYAWFYDGSPLYTILGGIAMVAIILAGVMFPLWPIKLRIGASYVSKAALVLIGAFIGLAIFRLIFWCITVLSMKRAIWIFPNLFEDVGFVDSFIPGWAYDEPKKKRRKLVKKSEKGSKSEKKSAAENTDSVEKSNSTTPATSTPVAQSTAVEPTLNGNGLQNRSKQATVEDVEED